MSSFYGSGAVTDANPRCWRCSRLLAELATRPWRIKCGRCKAVNQDGVKLEQETPAKDPASP